MIKIAILSCMLALSTSLLASPLPRETKIIQASKSKSMHEKKYTTLIFDLGGVIVDEKQIGPAADKLYPGSNAATIMTTIYRQKHWGDFDRGVYDIPTFAQLVEREYGFNPATTTLLLKDIVSSIPLLSYGIEILQTAKKQGYKVYALSNAYHGIFEAFVQKHEVFKLFDGAIISCNVGHIKPEAEIYNALLNQYNINPDEALFIDDLETNIVGATAVGIDGIVCRDPKE
ncbi:HAD family phosphatase, partial [Candidatus Dependentiae bacterium]|nr:HAD family phosphatase [Candidatus Dependentiae bacterium]